MTPRHLLPYRIVLSTGEVFEEVFAVSKADAAAQLERWRRGASFLIVTNEPDYLWYVRERPAAQEARR